MQPPESPILAGCSAVQWARAAMVETRVCVDLWWLCCDVGEYRVTKLSLNIGRTRVRNARRTIIWTHDTLSKHNTPRLRNANKQIKWLHSPTCRWTW